jgi:hypothetical protein
MKVSNRQAAKDRDLQLEALAAFANMGDTPFEWQKFRLKCRRFFPDDSLYTRAEQWLTTTLEPFLPYTTTRLLLYRDHLRRVWAGSDQKGESLTILYGFEKKLNPVEPKNAQFGEPGAAHPLFLGGKGLRPDELDQGMLPEGKPAVDGVSGEILWTFGSEFQQSLYELMRFRWRARICVQCGRYFVADKTAQTFCSPNCSDSAKRARSRDYWRRLGSMNRKARKEGGSE